MPRLGMSVNFHQSPLAPLNRKAQTLLDSLFTKLDARSLCSACEHFVSQRGTVFFTATGSTAAVAKKAAQTFVSVNIKSAYLHPLDALHGDLGAVSKTDTVVFLQAHDRCTNDDELRELLLHVQRRNCYTLAVVCAESSIMVEYDKVITLPLKISLGQLSLLDFDIAVTYVLDVCVSYMMNTMEAFNEKVYAANHPSGWIGKRLTMKVIDVFIPWQVLPLVSPDERGIHVLAKLAKESKGCHCLLVVDAGRNLLGSISDADFRRALLKVGTRSLDMTVSELMNFQKSYPRVCYVSDLAIAALNELHKEPVVDYLPVVSSEHVHRVEGLVTVKLLTQSGLK